MKHVEFSGLSEYDLTWRDRAYSALVSILMAVARVGLRVDHAGRRAALRALDRWGGDHGA